MDLISRFLNKITMYRLMLVYLLTLFAAVTLLSLANILPYDPVDVFLAGLFLVVICNSTNYLLSKIFGARANVESASITALILALIFGPLPIFENVGPYLSLGFFAMASKYLFAPRKKHLFNPAAFAVFLVAVLFNQGASWWIGNVYVFPIIAVGGLLILLKLKVFDLVLAFLGVHLLTSAVSGISPFTVFSPSSPVWFFIFVMLVEPLTSPSTKNLRIAYGTFIALVLFAFQKFVPSFSYSFEASLLVGNLFTLFVSPTFNAVLEFKRREKKAKDTWAFYFAPGNKFNFTPGQYFEWTYPHNKTDSRGSRRYFTVSSSPNESDVMVTMRVSEKSSSFKKALLMMQSGAQITASGPHGEFILPKDKNSLLCFIAGGIGITPFRSIVKFLLEKGESRDIVLIYSNSTEKDIAFQEIFNAAEKVGIKTHYMVTQRDGYVDEKTIARLVPDYHKRIFYVSGPQPMVEAFNKMLKSMEVKQIKTDFFPGYTDTHQK